MKQNQKRLAIIQVGFRLMDKKGYSGTGISEIIAEAGIPKGSFYHYFQNKESFAAEVINFYAQEVLFHVRKKLDDKSISPIMRIKNLYNGYAKSMINTHTFPYGGFASKISQEVGEQNMAVRNASCAVFNAIKQTHIECLNEAVGIDEIDKNTDIKNLAELIIFAWEGAIIRMKGAYKTDSLISFTIMLNEIILPEKQLI
ncbi:MAG: TetR/AcrR family transcriptional regulator [Bacteroidota bacterium]|nr:TetR/AcrR family transcriptional regulator [Bacteroidota bacterium]